jgi:hypothetical protein
VRRSFGFSGERPAVIESALTKSRHSKRVMISILSKMD